MMFRNKDKVILNYEIKAKDDFFFLYLRPERL